MKITEIQRKEVFGGQYTQGDVRNIKECDGQGSLIVDLKESLDIDHDPARCNVQTIKKNSTHYENCLNGVCCKIDNQEHVEKHHHDIKICLEDEHQLCYQKPPTSEDFFESNEAFLKKNGMKFLVYRDCDNLRSINEIYYSPHDRKKRLRRDVDKNLIGKDTKEKKLLYKEVDSDSDIMSDSKTDDTEKEELKSINAKDPRNRKIELNYDAYTNYSKPVPLEISTTEFLSTEEKVPENSFVGNRRLLSISEDNQDYYLQSELPKENFLWKHKTLGLFSSFILLSYLSLKSNRYRNLFFCLLLLNLFLFFL